MLGSRWLRQRGGRSVFRGVLRIGSCDIQCRVEGEVVFKQQMVLKRIR